MLPLLAALVALPFVSPSPLQARFVDPHECAPSPFVITNFSTFESVSESGTSSTISFTLTNPNPGGDIPRECEASYPAGGSVVDTTGTSHGCSFSGSYFTYPAQGGLIAWQPMGCPTLETDVVAGGNGTVSLACTQGKNGVICVQDGDAEIVATWAD
ncbi:hypothetical protein QBC46DRAFT_346322 [Diplogelasinospora grovesii]|uniref:AA1-like domain-containing protein n=1 Tax=Diplogelasinospora grovesii TaxID=303347 RepID=A0AAN6RZK7_9PEZI|nr:hypothetical protein QBC46DRAFT_346322 [Diplogelasinospora grovesii]